MVNECLLSDKSYPQYFVKFLVMATVARKLQGVTDGVDVFKIALVGISDVWCIH